MRKSLVIAAIAVAAVPGAALAGGPAEDERDRAGRHAAAAPGHGAGAPDRDGAAHAGRRGRGPSLVARGTIARIDAGGTGFTLRLVGGNRPLRRAAAGASELTVLLDTETAIDPFTTRIRVKGHGRAALVELAAGDRVLVTWRAPRGTDAAALATIEARRVIAHAPRPAADDDASREDDDEQQVAPGDDGVRHDARGDDGRRHDVRDGGRHRGRDDGGRRHGGHDGDDGEEDGSGADGRLGDAPDDGPDDDGPDEGGSTDD